MNKKIIVMFSILCVTLFITLISCEPEPEPRPLGVYGTDEHPIYIVMLEGHDIDDLFDIEGTVTNIWCSSRDDAFDIEGVVHYADTVNGARVGWNADMFYYDPFPDRELLAPGTSIANMLHYNGDTQGMPLEDAVKYIKTMKTPS